MLCVFSNNNILFKDLSFLYDFLSFLTFDLRRMGLECIIKKYKYNFINISYNIEFLIIILIPIMLFMLNIIIYIIYIMIIKENNKKEKIMEKSKAIVIHLIRLCFIPIFYRALYIIRYSLLKNTYSIN